MTKTKTPVNRRDKELLIVLAFILAAFIIYYFLMNPAIKHGGVLSEDAKAAKAEYTKAVEVVKNLPELKKENSKKLTMISEKYKQFFYEINEERILYKLDPLIAAAGLPMSSLTITMPYPEAITVETEEYSPLNYPLKDLAAKSNDKVIIEEKEGVDNNNTEKLPPDAVAYSDFQIAFTAGTYESVYNLIKSVEGLDRAIIIKNVNIQKAQDGTGLEGEILMGVYSIAKPNELDSTDLEFKPALPKGKANPFI